MLTLNLLLQKKNYFIIFNINNSLYKIFKIIKKNNLHNKRNQKLFFL